MQSLYDAAWVDGKTRAVFCEFTLYNPSVNLFTGVAFLVELPPTGAAVSMSSILTYRPYQHIGAYGSVMIVAQVMMARSSVRFSSEFWLSNVFRLLKSQPTVL